MTNLKLAVWFIALNVLDAALSHTLDARGALIEANPVMRPLIEQSWALTWGVKMAVIIGLSIILLGLSKKYPREMRIVFIGSIALMVGVCVVGAIVLLL